FPVASADYRDHACSVVSHHAPCRSGVGGNPEYARKALGKSGRNQMNNLRIYTAHKIATHGGGSKRQATYEKAAKFVMELPPDLRKEFSEKRIVTIRKETDRRFSKKARKLKKLDNDREFPSTDFVAEIYEFADESIKACKGDHVALLELSLCAVAAIRLP